MENNSMYKGKIDSIKSSIQNEYYYHFNDIKEEKKEIKKEDLIKKIDDIFLSKNFIYQADVNILYKNGENINKKLICRRDNNLICLDGEKILIDDILDIK